MARGTGFIAVVASLHKSGFGQVELVTHRNAGWLTTVDWGTALAPTHRANHDGIPAHVRVDETRPQSICLELGQQHTLTVPVI